MPVATEKYDARRAEMLAQLVLTRRKDVNVIPVGPHSNLGLDFFVTVGRPTEKGILSTFAVEVKSTSDPLAHENAGRTFLTRNWKHLHMQGYPLCPAVVFLFSLDNDQGYWSWLMEPRVTDRGLPVLERVDRFDLKKITANSIDALVASVDNWYEAMVDTVVTDETKRL